MATTHIVYDTNSGRIGAAHHYRGDAADPDESKRAALEFKELGLTDQDLGVLAVSDYATDPDRFFRVDVDKKALVEIDQGGVRFEFGGTTRPTGGTSTAG